MAVSFSCSCEERKKPVTERNWVVVEYKWNSGAFVAGDGEYSDYSEVRCLSCCARGRTKAKYVEKLRHMDRTKAMDIAVNQLERGQYRFDRKATS